MSYVLKMVKGGLCQKEYRLGKKLAKQLRLSLMSQCQHMSAKAGIYNGLGRMPETTCTLVPGR